MRQRSKDTERKEKKNSLFFLLSLVSFCAIKSVSSDELDALLLFRFQSAKETTQGLGQVAVERERESQAVGPAGLSLCCRWPMATEGGGAPPLASRVTTRIERGLRHPRGRRLYLWSPRYRIPISNTPGLPPCSLFHSILNKISLLQKK